MPKLSKGERFWFKDHFEFEGGEELSTVYVLNHGPGVLHTNDEDDTGFGPHPPGGGGVGWTMQASREFLELWQGTEATFEVRIAPGQWEVEDMEGERP